MSNYDLYGIENIKITEAKSRIEKKLDIKFTEKEGLFQGGTYYQSKLNNQESLVLKNNIDPFDGEAAEQTFSEYPILLYINDTENSEKIKSLLGTEFSLLRHEFFD